MDVYITIHTYICSKVLRIFWPSFIHITHHLVQTSARKILKGRMYEYPHIHTNIRFHCGFENGSNQEV